MSEVIGPVAVLPRQADGPLFPGSDGASAETRAMVDAEVRRIVDDCYAQALSTLQAERSRLDALAGALLQRETLDEPDIYSVVGLTRPPTPATTR
jgi:cell division protease FtsH